MNTRSNKKYEAERKELEELFKKGINRRLAINVVSDPFDELNCGDTDCNDHDSTDK